jgi:putative SOS response-associated peptidase YedK
MCGSYLNKISKAQYKTLFDVDVPDRLEHLELLRYTDQAPIIVQRDDRLELILARWGFVPNWAASLDGLNGKYANARDDKLASGMWLEAFLNSRCIIPISAYFEGRKKDDSKCAISLRSERPMGVAGLRSTWRGADNVVLETMTMITTTPSSDVAHVHHRMPALLKPRDYRVWLDHETPLETLEFLIRPYLSERLKIAPEMEIVRNVPSNALELQAIG